MSGCGVRICAWNCDHLAADSIPILMSLMHEQRLDVLALQETEHLARHWDDFPLHGSCRLISPTEVNGVGFLLHDKVFANLRNQHIVREFGLIVLEAEGVRQIFLNLHLPDDGTLKDRSKFGRCT